MISLKTLVSYTTKYLFMLVSGKFKNDLFSHTIHIREFILETLEAQDMCEHLPKEVLRCSTAALQWGIYTFCTQRLNYGNCSTTQYKPHHTHLVHVVLNHQSATVSVSCAIHNCTKCYDWQTQVPQLTPTVNRLTELRFYSTQNRSFRRRSSYPITWRSTKETESNITVMSCMRVCRKTGSV